MKVSKIAELCDLEIEGDSELELHSISGLKNLASGTLGFVDGETDSDFSEFPNDSCLIVSNIFELEFSGTLIRSDNPKFHFSKIAQYLHFQSVPKGWHKTASVSDSSDCKAAYIGPNVVVEDGANVGENTVIHAGVYIGRNSQVGKGTELFPDVTVYENSEIGSECTIHAGVKIGSPGFGYVRNGDEILQFPQIGKVIIGNRVEVGSNTCIDRGSLDDTFIDDDTKIDNLCQIAHNVKIGKRVRIAAHVGISGSAVIEDNVLIGGQVGIADHVVVKAGAVLGARSAVFPGKIVRKGIWAGTPVRPLEKYKKENALIRSLERLSDDVKRIKESG